MIHCARNVSAMSIDVTMFFSKPNHVLYKNILFCRGVYVLQVCLNDRLLMWAVYMYVGFSHLLTFL
jgi:hypothetical protein